MMASRQNGKTTPTGQSDKQHTGEEGFALYLSIGFIVLISVLAGSVGNRLNVTALAEARAGDSRGARDDAEQALSEGWRKLQTEYALDPNYLTSASSMSVEESADHTACVGSHESNMNDFEAFDRVPASGDSYRRYFIKRDTGLYKIYGCGFEPRGTRAAYGEYDDDGVSLSLARLRRY